MPSSTTTHLARAVEQLASALRHQLGDAVIAIDHIGSTAVPGLAAKDVIDAQVTVASLADAERLGDDLAAIQNSTILRVTLSLPLPRTGLPAAANGDIWPTSAPY